MNLLINMAAASLFAAVFRKAMKKFPAVLYAVATVLDILLLVGFSYGLPVWMWRVLMTFQVRGLFAFALFAVVMFAGVFKDGSRIKEALMPVRAELSIIASILIAGHVVNYAGIYLARVLSPRSADAAMLLSFLVALVLVVLLVPLGVTSVKAVKKRMRAKSWKTLQRFAYLFFGLIYVHIGFILLQPLLSGAQEATVNFVLYTALFAAYVLLRVRRHVLDAKTEKVKEAERLVGDIQPQASQL